MFANEKYLGKMQVISKESKYYPKNLKDVPNAPQNLYIIGNPKVLNQKSIAIVGDRDLSQSGNKLDHFCTRYYVKHGFATIGGLARGADSESCKETLANNGKNISILAGGLDQPIYPPENKKMAKEVIQKGGAVVSPYPLGTRIRGYQFVQRDAWQSGMSNGVLAIQARTKSGTRHTMTFAIKQHKPLAAPDYQKKNPNIVQDSGETQYDIDHHTAYPLTNIKSMYNFMGKMNNNYIKAHNIIPQQDLEQNNNQTPKNVQAITGDLFKSHAQTLVNTVNTKGAMGAGIALKFKQKYPNMYKQYRELCRQGKIKVGHPWLYKPKDKNKQWVLNFPTKESWRNPSQMSYVESGLKNLQQNYKKWGIKSIAVPPLGAGLGGLNWSKVKPLTDKYLSKMNIKTMEYQPLPNNRYYQHNFYNNQQSQQHWWNGKTNVYYLDSHYNLKKQSVNYKKMPYKRGVSHYSRRYAQSISSQNLHKAYQQLHPNAKPIEISSASNSIGKLGSAMNLDLQTSKGKFKVEQLYQAGKVFQGQTPKEHKAMAHKILTSSPWQAKRFLPKGRQLKEFNLFNHKFPLAPKNYYYDTLYSYSLIQHPKLASKLSKYNAYTDVYAGKNVVNTQAKTCALYSSINHKFGNDMAKSIIKNPKKMMQLEKHADKSLNGFNFKQLNLTPQHKTEHHKIQGKKITPKKHAVKSKKSSMNPKELKLEKLSKLNIHIEDN